MKNEKLLAVMQQPLKSGQSASVAYVATHTRVQIENVEGPTPNSHETHGTCLVHPNMSQWNATGLNLCVMKQGQDDPESQFY